MRIQEILYYARSFKLSDLVAASLRELVDAFEERIRSCYLDSADLLDKSWMAFVAVKYNDNMEAERKLVEKTIASFRELVGSSMHIICNNI